MGYYTYFALEARNVKNEEEYNSIINVLKERELFYHEDVFGVFNESKYYDDSHTAYFDSNEESKWYDHTYDMIKVSRLFPDVTFRLAGNGEEQGDIWHEYFHNGESEECLAHIVYDKPQLIEWEE